MEIETMTTAHEEQVEKTEVLRQIIMVLCGDVDLWIVCDKQIIE